MAEELWKEIVINGEKSSTKISNTGKLLYKRAGISYGSPDSSGYMAGTIKLNGKDRKILVHREVARAFINPDIDGKDVHHKNGNRSDNRVENLEIIDHSDHARLTLKENNISLTPEVVNKICIDIIDNKLSPAELGDKYGVGTYVIYTIIERKTYKEISSKYDFSKYKFRRNPNTGSIHAELRDKIRDGVPYDEIRVWLYDLGYSLQQIYSMMNYAKKAIKNIDSRGYDMGQGGRKNFKEYTPRVDTMIITGYSFKDIYDYLKRETSFTEVEINNFIRRRITAVNKQMEKDFT